MAARMNLAYFLKGEVFIFIKIILIHIFSLCLFLNKQYSFESYKIKCLLCCNATCKTHFHMKLLLVIL